MSFSDSKFSIVPVFQAELLSSKGSRKIKILVKSRQARNLGESMLRGLFLTMVFWFGCMQVVGSHQPTVTTETNICNHPITEEDGVMVQATPKEEVFDVLQPL